MRGGGIGGVVAGTPIKNQMIQLTPNMPTINTTNFVWTSIGDLTTQNIVFEVMVRNNSSVKVADWLICNSASDIEPAAFKMASEIIPIGPILASGQNSRGHFWKEDTTCLEWLDQQPQRLVIYIAFGSFTVFN